MFNENAQSGVGQLPVAEALPELWVDDENDWQRAEDVVRRFEAAPRVTPHCVARPAGRTIPATSSCAGVVALTLMLA